MFKGIIYKYTSPSNKVYIGQTIDEEVRRAAFLNLNKSYAGFKIDTARQKYGPENFKYEILSTVETEDLDHLKEILNISEKYYIAKYNSIIGGYNISEGGEQVIIEKTKSQIDKQKESLKKYYESHVNPNSKSILQYTLQGNFKKEWESMTKAAEYYQCDIRSISNCCRGVSKTAEGYIWKVKDSEDFPRSIEPVKRMPRKRPKPKYGIIVQLDMTGKAIQEWESPVDAAKAIGIKSSSNIIQVCIGNRNSLKGYLWKFKDESDYIRATLKSKLNE